MEMSFEGKTTLGGNDRSQTEKKKTGCEHSEEPENKGFVLHSTFLLLPKEDRNSAPPLAAQECARTTPGTRQKTMGQNSNPEQAK
jgi:hypothetical protein